MDKSQAEFRCDNGDWVSIDTNFVQWYVSPLDSPDILVLEVVFQCFNTDDGYLQYLKHKFQ